jgi:hypothetical protein
MADDNARRAAAQARATGFWNRTAQAGRAQERAAQEQAHATRLENRAAEFRDAARQDSAEAATGARRRGPRM